MKASVRNIIWNDWPALFAFCAIPIIWIIHFAFPYIRKGGSTPIELGISLTILASLALTWRILRIKRLFNSGERTEGILRDVQLFRDRGRLEYSFLAQGNAVDTWCPVHKSKQVLALQIGQKITVLFDRQSPHKSIVADLFMQK